MCFTHRQERYVFKTYEESCEFNLIGSSEVLVVGVRLGRWSLPGAWSQENCVINAINGGFGVDTPVTSTEIVNLRNPVVWFDDQTCQMSGLLNLSLGDTQRVINRLRGLRSCQDLELGLNIVT